MDVLTFYNIFNIGVGFYDFEGNNSLGEQVSMVDIGSICIFPVVGLYNYILEMFVARSSRICTW